MIVNLLKFFCTKTTSDEVVRDCAEMRNIARGLRMKVSTYELLKRALDVTVAGAGLVATAPIMSVAAVGVAFTMGLPLFFRQERPGKGGHTFRLVKFRTMRHPRVTETVPEADQVRLTSVGKVLRSLSIDELPSLWNVLKGDMSMVGPRPLLVQYLGRYSSRHARRHEVKPGITGWAQVNGRNSLSWDEKFELDVWYVDNRSLSLDLKILLKTFAKVLAREGIGQKGHATMPEFMGSGVADKNAD